MLRAQERYDDPLVAIRKRKAKALPETVAEEDGEDAESKPRKRVPRPMYKGAPWPNRFNILPGYRWDGVERGNGFEKKRFLAENDRRAKATEAYRYSVGEM